MQRHVINVILLIIAGGGCVDGGSAGSSSSSSSGAQTSSSALDAGTVDAHVEPACGVEAPTSCTNAALRFQDVQPILSQRCQACHSAAAGISWPLEQYSHVKDWADDVRTDLVNCTMPPPDAGIVMTLEERMTVLTWLRCGHPE